MDKLAAMQVYISVVETHGFARAAEVLGLPRSTVFRVIRELESWLGIRLLQRTTRKLSITAEGQRYYDECKRILTDIAAVESSFPARSEQPGGRFKVGMPQSLARHCMIPGLPSFLRQYPGLEVVLCSSDNVEDIIREGYDCVIRTGRIEDSTTLVARPLPGFTWVVLAAPSYIDAFGKPQKLDELEKHHAVGYLDHRSGRTTEWFFTLDDGDRSIRMREALIVDDTDAYIQAGIQGIGLIRVASYLAMPYLQSGELVPCLENSTSELPLSLVYPYSRYIPPSVRAFYDWSRTMLSRPNTRQ